MISITLPNGMKLEGTVEQVTSTMKKLELDTTYIGDSRYYFSETKGPVLIKDMNTFHLRNAILKHYAQWVADLHSIAEPRDLCAKMCEGPEDKTWRAMLAEYSTRKV